uniref:Uncharacterized protein n=2 Tax=Oryza TaxID=4527 RepID=A0A0D3EZ86_9ORYZ
MRKHPSNISVKKIVSPRHEKRKREENIFFFHSTTAPFPSHSSRGGAAPTPHRLVHSISISIYIYIYGRFQLQSPACPAILPTISFPAFLIPFVSSLRLTARTNLLPSHNQFITQIEMECESNYSKEQRLNGDSLVFDLDDTLYPVTSGIGADVVRNIQAYMIEKLGVEESISLELCVLLYKQYGTTMAGLRAVGYQFDYDDFHSYVHGRLAYEKIKPDPVLRNILLSLPIRKVVFTNGDRIHASRALKRLGIEDCFERVVCFETLNPTSSSLSAAGQVEIFDIMKHLAHPEPGVELPKSPILCKPNIDAMLQALKVASINPKTSILFDDSARNIQAAKQIGMYTVLVGTSERIKGADHALESLHNMKEALPELWDEAVKDEDVRKSSKVGIETSVIA